MRFEITFHGPFRVATGKAGHGLDVTVDSQNLVPASSIKGLMRAAAAQIMPAQRDLRRDVFGSERTPSPWSWSSARFERHEVRRRARVRIAEETMTAVEGALMLAEEVWSQRATFSVDQLQHLADDVRERHELLLLASAHAVHALGSDRRRGLGWVGVAALDPVLDAPALEAVVKLASGAL